MIFLNEATLYSDTFATEREEHFWVKQLCSVFRFLLWALPFEFAFVSCTYNSRCAKTQPSDTIYLPGTCKLEICNLIFNILKINVPGDLTQAAHQGCFLP